MGISIRYLAAPGRLRVREFGLLTELTAALKSELWDNHLVVDLAAAHWWLAWKDKKPVAFGGLIEWPGVPSCGLYLVGVLPEARGHGIQRRLIRAREKKARALGYKRVVTWTWPSNAVSRANLEACGYSLYEPKVKFGTPNSVYYEKELG